VSFQSQADALTYEPYFGLTEKPFSLNADPRFIYDSPTYTETYEGLLAGIRRREGLLVLTGEIGAGKTTLCRAVLRDLGRRTCSSLVSDPFASREDLLKMLLIDFGVSSIQDLTNGPLRQASRTELGYLLAEFLNALAVDAHAVVVIDEAQNLSLPLIEETRLLADTFGAKGRLQIVYAGQPELQARLKSPEMRQVDQRVCGYHRLAAMSRDAVAGYVQHRLHVAGAHRDRVLFPPAVLDVLHQRTGGVPRLINRICDRALQIAHKRQAERVDREILDTALLEVGSATLSPTWDAIVAAPPAPAVVATATPAPTSAPAVLANKPAPPIDDEENFKRQIDHWVEQDLAPPSRTLTKLGATFVDESAARRPAPRTARGVPQTRAVPTDWPRDRYAETYMHRRLRKWAKRAAIAVAVFIAVNAAISGGSLVLEQLTPTTLPASPEAPAVAVAALAAPTLPVPSLSVPEAPRTETPQPAANAAAPTADSNEYLVAVGLFADRERADQLVDTLTRAGFSAMQRPFQLRRQQVQQIVLGPFFSRSEAVADLARLQQLGGYGDASVISAK
jgi:type II secretory pathway predicted ATPase ExeA/cell division septation protein DedD